MGGTTGGDQTSDRRPFPRGAIRYQIGKFDYLQKPLPTGKISGQARSAKKEPHRGAPTEIK